jgi:transcriptional regulator with XRE-family HTH domain
MTIGEKIKYLRQQRGMTLTSVAKHLELSPSTLSRIERDCRKAISLPVVNKLIEFYKIDFESLIDSRSIVINKVWVAGRIIRNLQNQIDYLEGKKEIKTEYKNFDDGTICQMIVLYWDFTGNKDADEYQLGNSIGVYPERMKEILGKYKLK